ncbi:UrcA family protein [Sphingomonas sp. BIUV-7]|uniref:UrcA family protein n=1 Tax=Sphingomonas natans TaxID=3063330 RepID=A0ABT8Y753_9SPHN|nr:UrcA family protein [Sphingomonas sp. BIUV-7]MDO6413564.1 UrcA family protein [Sphingomonas sp. BIUV-7]
MRSLSTVTVALAVAAGFVATVPASATTRLRQVAVQYSYGDLATASGRADLDQRIHRAAKTVCTTPMTDRLGDAACINVVEEQAQSELRLRHAAGTILAAR